MATAYTATLTSKSGKSVGLTLALNLTTGHPVVTGMVTDGSISFNLAGYRIETIPAKQTAAQTGHYTFLLPPPGNAVGIGYGYGTASVSKSGAVTFSGALGDGTVFTAGAKLTDSGFVLLSVPLYSNDGYLNGFLQFRNVTGESDFDGTLVWSQRAKVGPKVVANAVQTTIAAVGSLFAEPPKGSNLFSFSAGQVTFSNGGLLAASSTSVTIGAGNAVTTVKPDPNGMACTLNARTGAFDGSFVVPGTKTKHSFKGVVFLKNPCAAGEFKGVGTAGYGGVELVP